MPGSDQRDAQGMRDPQSQDPDIARAGDVHKIRLKRPHLLRDPILVAA